MKNVEENCILLRRNLDTAWLEINGISKSCIYSVLLYCYLSINFVSLSSKCEVVMDSMNPLTQSNERSTTVRSSNKFPIFVNSRKNPKIFPWAVLPSFGHCFVHVEIPSLKKGCRQRPHLLGPGPRQVSHFTSHGKSSMLNLGSKKPLRCG